MIFVFCVIVFFVSAHYDLLELTADFAQKYEDWELDEFIVVAVFLTFILAFISTQQLCKILKSERELLQKNEELEKAFSEIKQLRGIIPICASCKKIRDDRGFWHQVEAYVRDHTDADFSHGICPECAEKLYPDFYLRNKDTLKK